jgi:hypothetical protein
MVQKRSTQQQKRSTQTQKRSPQTPEQHAIVRWTAGLGAITAAALAQHMDVTLASARARLAACERAGLLKRTSVLAGEPPLYTVTSAGLRAAGVKGVEPCRLSAANAPHAQACAGVAAALERAYPDQRVMGERELRHEERQAGAPLASASLGDSLHRPDLVLWPNDAGRGLPVAVEVELTVKAPQRLTDICRAWARCGQVAGVLYLVAPEVERPLARAIERAGAQQQVLLVGLDALPSLEPGTRGRSDPGEQAFESPVPGDA